MLFVPDTTPADFLTPPVSRTPTDLYISLLKVFLTHPVSPRIFTLLSAAKVL